MVIAQQQSSGNGIEVDPIVVIGKEEPATSKKSEEVRQHVEAENIDPDILGEFGVLEINISFLTSFLVKSSSLDPLKSHPKKQNPLITGLVTKEKAITTHSNLASLSEEKQQKLRELYDFLDVNRDGTIDIRDLTAALQKKRYFPSKLAPVSPEFYLVYKDSKILGNLCQYEA